MGKRADNEAAREREFLKQRQIERARIKRQRALKRKIKKFIFIIETMVVLALAVIVAIVLKFDRINKIPLDGSNLGINEGIDTVALSDYTNIAIFGLDAREDTLGKGNHSDVIMIASINNITNDIKIASIYRDTYLKIGESYNRANQAYYEGGAQVAVKMLNENLDLNIEGYITVNFTAVADAIDLLGGVDIVVEDEEIDWINGFATETAYVTEKEKVEVTNSGLQTLDGVQAVSYCRIRQTAGNEYRRTERQQAVMAAIIDKAKEADLLVLNSIVDTIFAEVETNLSNSQIIALVKKVSEYTLTDTMGFPADKTPQSINGKACIVPVDLAENVVQLQDFLFEDAAINYTPSDELEYISSGIQTLTGTN